MIPCSGSFRSLIFSSALCISCFGSLAGAAAALNVVREVGAVVLGAASAMGIWVPSLLGAVSAIEQASGAIGFGAAGVGAVIVGVAAFGRSELMLSWLLPVVLKPLPIGVGAVCVKAVVS